MDGGSRDATRAVARERGARVLSEPLRGYGRACARGVSEARGDDRGVSRCRRRQRPAGHPGARRSHREGERRSGARVAAWPGPRRGGAVCRHALPPAPGKQAGGASHPCSHGVPVTDLSPFRATRRAMLLDLPIEDLTYGWPTEMIVSAARAGWRIIEVPVSCRPRSGGRSKVSGTLRGAALAAVHILGAILAPRGSAGHRRSAARKPAHRHAGLPLSSSWRSAPCRARPRRVCARRSHPLKRPSCTRHC